MNWYVILDGQQIGPLTNEKVRQMIQDRQLNKTDLVWNESMPDWVEAGSVRDLYSPVEQLAVRPARSPGQQLHQKSTVSDRRKRLLLPIAISLVIIILIAATVFIFRRLDRVSGQNHQTTASQTTDLAPSSETSSVHLESDPDHDTDETDHLPMQTSATEETEHASSEPIETEISDPDQTSQSETDTTETEPEVIATEDPSSSDETLPDSESNIPVEAILDIMHQADKIALDYFKAAFEAELADEDKVPFSQIRPDLLMHRSRHHVDTDLAAFYEEGLFEWGFEMNQVFPFHDKDHLQKSFGGIVSQTEQTIVVFTAIEGSALNEGYSFYTVLILEDNKWVIDEKYSGS